MLEGAVWARPAAVPPAGALQSPASGTAVSAQSQRLGAGPAAVAATPTPTKRGGTGSAPSTGHASSAGAEGAARRPVKRAAAGSLMLWLQKGKGPAETAASGGATTARNASAAHVCDRPETVAMVPQRENPTQEPGNVPATATAPQIRSEQGQSSPAASPTRQADASGAAVHAPMAVRLIWVSAEHRRQGIASRLLDAAREHVVAGHVLQRRQLAFVQPTDAGCSLARAYTGSTRFLIS